jgi:hypothetical protein
MQPQAHRVVGPQPHVPDAIRARLQQFVQVLRHTVILYSSRNTVSMALAVII